MAPLPDRVNTIDNTFPIAIGLKKSDKWDEVEHQFRQDTKCFDNKDTPLYMYHGGLKKLVPVYVRRICSIEDKPERSEVTHTLGNTGKSHRLFGTVTMIASPICLDASDFLVHQKAVGIPASVWGWSDQFIVKDNNNGAYLSSCLTCRRNRIRWLLHPQQNMACAAGCQVCADWSFDPATCKLLDWPCGTMYPTTEDPSCPISAPPGRGVGVEHLSHISLTFEVLKDACRFAFFHLVKSNSDKYRWSFQSAKYYLTNCGVNGKQINEIWEQTKRFRANKIKDPSLSIDYLGDPLGVGDFRFPSSWVGPLPMSAYVEAIMHALFLGVAEWNFKLVHGLLANVGNGKKILRNCNTIIFLMKAFNLSWLTNFPINPDNPTMTGAWVSENWLAFTRISKIAYSWTICECDNKNLLGSADIMRLVISFHGLVARALSRSGVTEHSVLELPSYIKEFLNCTKELDIRLNYKAMITKPTRVVLAKEKEPPSTRQKEAGTHQDQEPLRTQVPAAAVPA